MDQRPHSRGSFPPHLGNEEVAPMLGGLGPGRGDPVRTEVPCPGGLAAPHPCEGGSPAQRPPSTEGTAARSRTPELRGACIHKARSQRRRGGGGTSHPAGPDADTTRGRGRGPTPGRHRRARRREREPREEGPAHSQDGGRRGRPAGSQNRTGGWGRPAGSGAAMSRQAVVSQGLGRQGRRSTAPRGEGEGVWPSRA